MLKKKTKTKQKKKNGKIIYCKLLTFLQLVLFSCFTFVVDLGRLVNKLLLNRYCGGTGWSHSVWFIHVIRPLFATRVTRCSDFQSRGRKHELSNMTYDWKYCTRRARWCSRTVFIYFLLRYNFRRSNSFIFMFALSLSQLLREFAPIWSKFFLEIPFWKALSSSKQTGSNRLNCFS